MKYRYCWKWQQTSPPHPEFVTWVTQQVPLVEQELFSLMKHLSSFLDCTELCVTLLSLVFCVTMGTYVSFCPFLLAIVLSMLLQLNSFWLSLWCFQNFFWITNNKNTIKPDHVVTSIKQSPVLNGHLFLVL